MKKDLCLLPDNFVYLNDFLPDVIFEMRYCSCYNFIGKPVDGYLAPVAIITKPAAEALKAASENLRKKEYLFKIFDAYRPQQAVNHFVRWASDKSDTLMKKYFYPDIEKGQLIPDGYIAEHSAHTRGSSVDITLFNMKTGREVDMGTPFDFLEEASHHGAASISSEQTSHRNILKDALENAGFTHYPQEWWHYTFINEPFPDTYFDFPVK